MASGSNATRDGAGKKLEELLYSGNGCEFVTVKVEPVSSDDDHQKEFFYDSEDSGSPHPPVPVKKEPYVVDVDLLYTGSSDDSDDQRPSKLPKIHDVEVKEEPPQIEYDVPILDMVDWAAALKESSTSRKRPSRSNESTTNESSVAPIILPITPLNKIFLGYDSEEEGFKPPAQAKPAPKRWRKIYRPESKMKRYATVSLSRLDESVVQSGTVTLPLSTPKPVAARPPRTFVGRGRTRKEKFEGPKGSLSYVFYCHHCDYATQNKNTLRIHAIIHLPRQFQCKICPYKSYTAKYLRQHMDTHTGKVNFFCTDCDFKTPWKHNLVTHRRTHTGERPYPCPLCPYRSSTSSSLKVHLSIHQGIRNFKCQYCPYAAQNSNTLKEHTTIHTGEKPHSCPHCDFRTSRKSALRDHIRLKHIRIKNILCPFCDYRSAHKGNMKSHIRTHTKEKPWKCDSCDLRFSTSSGLKNHKMNHEGVRRFQCDMCDYRSVQEVTMKQHVDQVHLNLTPYQCHECGYRCYSKRTLRLHIVVHMGTEYRCKMPGCSYLSDSRRRLADHKRRHAFMKPFCCKQCPFESLTKALMTKHLLCHTVERRFKCTKCSFSSGFNYVLQKHKLLHSNH